MNATCEAGAGPTTMLAVDMALIAGEVMTVAVSVYVPVLVSDRPENVATPLTIGTIRLPPIVVPVGPFLSVSVQHAVVVGVDVPRVVLGRDHHREPVAGDDLRTSRSAAAV